LVSSCTVSINENARLAPGECRIALLELPRAAAAGVFPALPASPITVRVVR
jgi:hypothetical protein